MKFVCLGYMDESLFEGASEEQQNEMIDACLAYDEDNAAAGYLKGGQGLQSSKSAATVRWQGGRAVVTDGPFSETKEQIGGIQIIEAEDLNHAIRIMSNHPSVPYGSIWEIRPAMEMEEFQRASAERRQSKVQPLASIG